MFEQLQCIALLNEKSRQCHQPCKINGMCASHYKKYLDDNDSVKTINHYSFKSIAEKSSDANKIFFTYEDFQKIYEK